MKVRMNQGYHDGEYSQFWPYVYRNGIWTLSNTHINNGSEWIEIPNWEKFTSFKPASGNISVSSSYSSTYDKANLVDGDLVAKTGSWATKTNVSYAWIKIDFLYPVKNLVVYIWNRGKVSDTNSESTALVNGPTAGRIQGSDDGSTWTNLLTFSGRGGNTGSAKKKSTHICNNSEDAYRYIRLYFTSWAGMSYNNNYCAVGEIAFDGELGKLSGAT